MYFAFFVRRGRTAMVLFELMKVDFLSVKEQKYEFFLAKPTEARYLVGISVYSGQTDFLTEARNASNLKEYMKEIKK